MVLGSEECEAVNAVLGFEDGVEFPSAVLSFVLGSEEVGVVISEPRVAGFKEGKGFSSRFGAGLEDNREFTPGALAAITFVLGSDEIEQVTGLIVLGGEFEHNVAGATVSGRSLFSLDGVGVIFVLGAVGWRRLQFIFDGVGVIFLSTHSGPLGVTLFVLGDSEPTGGSFVLGDSGLSGGISGDSGLSGSGACVLKEVGSARSSFHIRWPLVVATFLP